jgi:DNA (cytosine-5)-methyltransferase 1
VDINRQGNYPYPFEQGDAIAYLERLLTNTRAGVPRPFDAIHASPPCQAYTRKAADWGRKRNHWLDHPDLIAPTRDLLLDLGLPFVIENVPGAPITHDLMLCGTMFGLTIRKHRYFESNVPLGYAPRPCSDHSECYNPWQGKGRSAAKLRAAMGIDWLPISGGASRKVGYTGDLFNAIPPAYTEHIGKSLLESKT